VNTIDNEENRNSIQETVDRETKYITTWKDEYKELVNYHFDINCAKDSRVLEYSNNNRSVMNPKTEEASYWASTRCTRLLKPGNKYHWSFILDEFSRPSHNSFLILLGIETKLFPFHSQVGGDVLGYRECNKGCCLVVGSCESFHEAVRESPMNGQTVLKRGDCIGIVLDMSTGSDSAVIEFYQIVDQQATLIHRRNIPKNEYYPAVSMNQEMKVTIDRWPSSCKIVNK
jgi:hypothetical protein